VLLVFTDNLHMSSCHASAVSPVFCLHRRVARMVVYDPELWFLSTSYRYGIQRAGISVGTRRITRPGLEQSLVAGGAVPLKDGSRSS
jgi:hypothetical protein